MRRFTERDSRPPATLIDRVQEDVSHGMDRANDDGWRFDDKLELRREAEGMVHYLLVQSRKPALMVDTSWTLIGMRHEFQDRQLYEQVPRWQGVLSIRWTALTSGVRDTCCSSERQPTWRGPII